MKKINILMIAIALLAITLPVMAQVTFSGEVKGGFYQPIAVSTASVVNKSAQLSASFKADENVSGTFKVKVDNVIGMSDLTDITTLKFMDGVVIDTANASINLLGAMGVTDVPVVMTLTAGRLDTGASGVADFTHYAFEKFNTGVGTSTGFDDLKLDTKIMDLVTIRTGISPAEYSGNLAQFVVGAFGTVGPVSAELFYGNSKRVNGDVAIGAKFDQAFGDLALKVGGTFQIPLAENTDMEWGAGVSAAYTTLAKLTASAEGLLKQGTSTGDALKGIGIGVESTPIPLVTLKAGLTLDTRKDADMLDGVEFLGQLNLGKYTLGVGLNYATDDSKLAAADVLKNDAFTGKNATPGKAGFSVQSSVSF